jgi:hypothetical protein
MASLEGRARRETIRRGLADALGSGPSQEIFELDDALQEVASAGIEAILAGPVAALAATYDFARHRRLLDVGRGTGSWSIAVARSHGDLEATIFSLRRWPTSWTPCPAATAGGGAWVVGHMTGRPWAVVTGSHAA